MCLYIQDRMSPTVSVYLGFLFIVSISAIHTLPWPGLAWSMLNFEHLIFTFVLYKVSITNEKACGTLTEIEIAK